MKIPIKIPTAKETVDSILAMQDRREALAYLRYLVKTTWGARAGADRALQRAELSGDLCAERVALRHYQLVIDDLRTYQNALDELEGRRRRHGD
jgi:hypothetical protein